MTRFSPAALARIKLAKAWQAAYEAANGKEAPMIIWKHRRFHIHGSSQSYSRADVERMLETLQSRLVA